MKQLTMLSKYDREFYDLYRSVVMINLVAYTQGRINYSQYRILSRVNFNL